MNTNQILILTDIHVGSDKPENGIYNDKQLSLSLELVNELCPNADLLVVMGDLTHNGTQEQYQRFKELMEPAKMPVQLMIGNHDNVANYATAFPETVAEDGFVHTVRDLGGRRLIFLDTVHRGDERFEAFGQLCDQRLSWLEKRLAEAKANDQEVLIFMHHPPMALGLPLMDCIRLIDGPRFFDTITSYDNVAHIFCGHIHRHCHGIMNGIPVTSFKAVTQQAPLFFDSIDPNAWVAETGAFGLLNLNDDSMIVHTQDIETARLEVHTSNFMKDMSDGAYDLDVLNVAKDLLSRP